MFHLRWIFLFSFFVFSSLSLQAVGGLKEPDAFHILEGSHSEIKSSALINKVNERTTSGTFQPYPGIVRLITENEQKRWSGTGFFINYDMLTTAAHVADKGLLYFRDASTGERVFTEVLAIDKKYDLAILRAVNYESEHFYSVGSLDRQAKDFLRKVAYENQLEGFYPHEIEKGNAVIISGFPQGDFNIIQGDMTGNNIGFIPIMDVTHKTDREMLNFKGISGAPVFSSGRNLIGVAIIGNDLHDPDEFIGFTPVEMLRDLVRKVEGREPLLPVSREEIAKATSTILQLSVSPFLSLIISYRL